MVNGRHSCVATMADYRRFFGIKQKDNVILQGEEAYHFAKVLRARTGDRLIACCGSATDYLCEVLSVSPTRVICKILEETPNETENAYTMTLFQSVLKGDKTEFVLQKSVECGVNEFVPFVNDCSNSVLDEKKRPRLERIVSEACKQCGRAVVPMVQKQQTFAQVLSDLSRFTLVLFCNERENEKTMIDVIYSFKQKPENIAVIIGSEGGFSEREVQELQKLPNVRSVSLGKRILRAETASIAALCIANAALSEVLK